MTTTSELYAYANPNHWLRSPTPVVDARRQIPVSRIIPAAVAAARTSTWSRRSTNGTGGPVGAGASRTQASPAPASRAIGSGRTSRREPASRSASTDPGPPPYTDVHGAQPAVLKAASVGSIVTVTGPPEVSWLAITDSGVPLRDESRAQ